MLSVRQTVASGYRQPNLWWHFTRVNSTTNDYKKKTKTEMFPTSDCWNIIFVNSLWLYRFKCTYILTTFSSFYSLWTISYWISMLNNRTIRSNNVFMVARLRVISKSQSMIFLISNNDRNGKITRELNYFEKKFPGAPYYTDILIYSLKWFRCLIGDQ